MALSIHLLGVPGATRDGAAVEVRGRKAWAILAYLLLAGAPVARDRLQRVFFPDASDPSGVLRFNLSQLRRQLGIDIHGDPVVVALSDDVTVDVQLLSRGSSDEALALPGLGQDLLAGTTPGDSPAFEVWLEGERRHLRALSADVLREGALQRLARGDHDDAVTLAEQVVDLEPLDENAAVVLIRALSAAGRPQDAQTVADATAERLRRALGVEPSAALHAAVHTGRAIPGVTVRGRVAVEANREAGVAALAAGAVDAGIDLLREALGGARMVGDPMLLARTLTDLGSSLVHAVRGVDQDAAALLHEAVALEAQLDTPTPIATATRELGYVEMLRGRYARALAWFDRAAELAADDPVERAWVDVFAGTALTDIADHAGARRVLDDAVAGGDDAGLPGLRAMAHVMRGRQRLLVGDVDTARSDLDTALQLSVTHGLRAVAPWPATLLAEAELCLGRAEAATERFEHAYAASRQLRDPCWEAMALRGLGLVHAQRGELERGVQLLEAAPTECRRLPDTYRWVEVYALDALASVALERHLDRAPGWVHALDELATTLGMRDLGLRAARYRVTLGEPGADELLASRTAALAA